MAQTFQGSVNTENRLAHRIDGNLVLGVLQDPEPGHWTVEVGQAPITTFSVNALAFDSKALPPLPLSHSLFRSSVERVRPGQKRSQ
jgi:hypothetical protein